MVVPLFLLCYSFRRALMLKNMQISAGYELKLIVLIIYIRVEQTPSCVIIIEQDFLRVDRHWYRS